MASLDEILQEDKFPGNTSTFTELAAFMKDGAVIGITGAGVSVPLFPTWSSLLATMLQEAEKGGLLDRTEVPEWDSQIEADPLELANSLENLFTRKIFRAKFSRRFANPSGACTQTHGVIAGLNLRGVITLNYDDGHEVAYAQTGRKPNSGRSQDEATLTRWLQGEIFRDQNSPILHLHGDVSDPERMILTADDYNQFYQMSLPDAFIKQTWRSDRLLAVGFGFTDPFLTRAAETTLRFLPSDTRHFALIGRRDGEMISIYQRQLFAKKFRLTPVFYRIHTIDRNDGPLRVG
jgi:hypothetical protein